MPFVGRWTLVMTPLSPPASGGRRLSELVAVEALVSGQLVLGHDGAAHHVVSVVRRAYCGPMVWLAGESNRPPLLVSADCLVLSDRRVAALSAQGEWSAVPCEHFARARELRLAMSPPERRLWALLRGRQCGVGFRRQHPVGPYIADFYCREAGLVVEIDGDSHYREAEAIRHDAARDKYMARLGLRVLRFAASDVGRDARAVALAVVDAARERVLPEDVREQWRRAGSVGVGCALYLGPGSGAQRVARVGHTEVISEAYSLEVGGAHSVMTELCAVGDRTM